MARLAADTSAEIEERQRERHPDASDRDLFLRLAILTLGRDLAGQAYPDARSLTDALTESD